MTPDKAAMLHGAISLLGKLVGIKRYPGEEDEAAQLMEQWLQERGMNTTRQLNNVWALPLVVDTSKPTVLLNSHLDTVRPNGAYTRDPHKAIVEGDKLYGLGTTDAGGALCAMAEVYCALAKEESLPFNLVFLASAEEEISGKNGISAVYPFLPPIDMAIVGEPTSMRMSVAQKGLIVVDCQNLGEAGHAARDTGKNALYEAVDDIATLRALQWHKVSSHLGSIKCQATMIRAGIAHNQVPDVCDWVVDIRTTDAYTPEEIITTLKNNLKGSVEPRSTRLMARATPENSPFLKLAAALGIPTYGSETLSDWALIPCPAIKMGPGDTLRSHTADEYILTSEVEEGIAGYYNLLTSLGQYL